MLSGYAGMSTFSVFPRLQAKGCALIPMNPNWVDQHCFLSHKDVDNIPRPLEFVKVQQK